MATPAPVPVSGPRQASWFRALDHARLTGVKPTYRPSTDSYTVLSPRAQDKYTVRRVEIDGQLTYVDDCPAIGPCWHCALVAALPGEIDLRTHYAAAHTPPVKRCAICRTDAAMDGGANCEGCQAVYGDVQTACLDCGQVLKQGATCPDCLEDELAVEEASDPQYDASQPGRGFVDPVHARQLAITAASRPANVVPFERSGVSTKGASAGYLASIERDAATAQALSAERMAAWAAAPRESDPLAAFFS